MHNHLKTKQFAIKRGPISSANQFCEIFKIRRFLKTIRVIWDTIRILHESKHRDMNEKHIFLSRASKVVTLRSTCCSRALIRLGRPCKRQNELQAIRTRFRLDFKKFSHR